MRILVRSENSGEKTVGKNFGRHHEHQAVGHDDEFVAAVLVKHDVGFAVGVVGADELIAESDFAAEVGGPGFFCEEGIGAGFDQAAIDAIGDKDSAEARGGFEQDIFDLCVGLGSGFAFFFKRERGREAGDSAADDGDTWHKEATSY
jgi:hypothetical protein